MAEPNVMLVEGVDEWNFFNDLLRTSPLATAIEIRRQKAPRPGLARPPASMTPLQFKEMDGVDRLLNSLDQELRTSDLARLGIVIDADTDLAARWLQLRNILLGEGYTNVPGTPDADGTIVVGKRRVGIWIMPDNKQPGMLEDFIGLLVPAQDALWPQAEKSLAEAIVLDQRFVEAHHSKALVHTWLAWQEDPGTPFGLTFTRRCLDVSARQAQELLGWVSRLLELPLPA